MIPRAIRQFVKDQLEAAIRQVVLRGRASAGLYSAEGHAIDPAEPESTTTARRGSRYGFLSETPAGALVTIVKVGRGNFVAVAEATPGEPSVEEGEVLVWNKAGARVLLNKDGDVVVTPAAGRKVLLGDADGTACDPVVTKTQLNTILSTIKYHEHPVAGSVAGASTALTGAILSVDGSPNVSVKKP